MWYLLTDLKKLDLFTLFLCMSMCMWSASYICAYCPPSLEESVKFPGPELVMVVSYNIGSGN